MAGAQLLHSVRSAGRHPLFSKRAAQKAAAVLPALRRIPGMAGPGHLLGRIREVLSPRVFEAADRASPHALHFLLPDLV